MEADSFQMMLVMLVLLNLSAIAKASDAVCRDNQTGQTKCCQDYKNISGICEACIGSWGKNCQYNCTFGFFGLGCRQRCDCSTEQFCERRHGCIDRYTIENYTTTMSNQNKDLDDLEVAHLSVFGVLILVVLCVLVIICRKLNKSRKTDHSQEETISGNTNGQMHDDQECIYNECEQPRIDINNDSLITICHYTLPRGNSESFHNSRFKSLPSKSRGYKRHSFKRSRSIETKLHEHDCRGFDVSRAPNYTQDASQNYIDDNSAYGYSSSARESVLSTQYSVCSDQLTAYDKTNFNHGVLNKGSTIYSTTLRPYSSVKYNRAREVSYANE